jgi:hypothetical protein
VGSGVSQDQSFNIIPDPALVTIIITPPGVAYFHNEILHTDEEFVVSATQAAILMSIACQHIAGTDHRPEQHAV